MRRKLFSITFWRAVIIGAAAVVLAFALLFFREKIPTLRKINQPDFSSSAREIYRVAQSRALNWSDDAALSNIATTAINQQGKSENWQVIFYSSNKKQALFIVTEKGTIKTEIPIVEPQAKETLSGDFVDSTVVIQNFKQVAPKNKLEFKSLILKYDEASQQWLWIAELNGQTMTMKGSL